MLYLYCNKEIKIMLNKINFKTLIGAIVCFIIAVLIIFGKTGITFADPLNEMVCFVIANVLGIFLLAASGKN
jgi:hypothetical protein